MNTYTVTLVCVDVRGNTINKAEFVTQANLPLIMSAYEGLVGKRIRDYFSGEILHCVSVECVCNQIDAPETGERVITSVKGVL